MSRSLSPLAGPAWPLWRPAAAEPDGVPTSGLVLRIQAEDLGLNDGDQVTSWADRSPLALTLTPPGASNRPIFKANQINGRPSVYFEYDSAVKRVEATWDPTGWTDGELVAVIKGTDGNADPNKAGGFFHASNCPDQQHYPWTNGQIYESFGRSVRAPGVSALVSLGAWHTYNCRSTASAKDALINGTMILSQGSGTTGWNSTVRVGAYTAANTFFGHVAAIFCWNRVLTTEERAAVHSYINGRWGLTLV